MKQEVQIKDNTIMLDSEIKYSGSENPSDDEKQIRRAVGLPITKQLIYYNDKNDTNSVVNIKHYQLVEMYNITDRWYTVEITTESDQIIRIQSDYLIEMQKPNFVADMAAQKA